MRELVSNASDALEKCRHEYLAKGEDPGELKVTITTDDAKRQFVIQDTGLGMSRDDLVANLGTIARSGSKAFVEEQLNAEAEAGAAGASAASSSSSAIIIGKFGVGFYSAFMVSDRVDVYSSTGDGTGWKWSSAGDGSYTLSPCDVDEEGAEGAAEGKAPKRGTRIVLHVKEADKTVATAGWAVETTLKKYSAFVGFPVTLNGKRTNDIDALWTKRQNEVTDEEATAFYRFIAGGALDAPAFRLHFSADAPLTIRALLFAPSDNPERGFAHRNLEGREGPRTSSDSFIHTRHILY